MARENPTWGYDRIQGVLKSLDHVVAPNTIKKILKQARNRPRAGAREGRPGGSSCARSSASIAAGDFFSTEVWTARGLVTWYTFFVIPNPDHADAAGKIVRRSRLGGLLSHYHRLAA